MPGFFVLFARTGGAIPRQPAEELRVNRCSTNKTGKDILVLTGTSAGLAKRPQRVKNGA